jgi:hypothetical protein
MEPFGNAYPPVFHGKNVENEFFLTGVLRTPEVEGPVSGSESFFGDVTLNYANARGSQRGHSTRFVVDESPVGAGAWDCRATYVMEPYEGGGWVAWGQVTGCKGTGVFEGMNMKLFGTNEPPLPPGQTFRFSGEIW